IIIKNQLSPYQYQVKIETLEVLINQLINSETIDFVGEPLEGLQLMGLLETRLLNFENIILLSANEGKLPLGNSQNTYLPFDVRKQFNLHTFLENDGIYAYHFYRFLQNAKNIYLLYNALGSGVNTGEKTRFITQIEMESQHKIEHIIIENTSEPINQEPITIEKTPAVLEKLEEWKQKVSPSHLVTYLYNPIDFYLDKILNTRETTEIEEELSQRNYGTLVHNALEYLYGKIISKILKVNDLENLLQQVDESIDKAIERLKHQPEFYEKGMNFVHKQIAKRVVESVLNYDLELVKNGNALEIVALERKIENIPFKIDENNGVIFYGFIDRIDILNGTLRIIDYKTAKPKNLKIKVKEDKIENLFFDDKHKQAMQLCIYQYCISQIDEFKNRELETGIWSFAEVNNGVQKVEFTEGNFEDSLVSVKNLILEILNPEIPFTEKVHESWN
ncbi:MAG: PD-(D/E)XK nuclease family protein, partial [Cloacibacterium sp.]|nr:PD-(D/E)XK nuclease family protein [Cloacibacterium sp.]